MQNGRAGAVRPDDVRIVRDQDEGPIFSFLKKFDVAAVVESRIAHHHRLVDQKAVELDRHGERKCEASHHSVRVLVNGLAQIPIKFGEFLDECEAGAIVDAVNAANEFQIVEAGQIWLERSRERQRPGDRHPAEDAS